MQPQPWLDTLLAMLVPWDGGWERLPECEAVEDLSYGVVGAVGVGEDAK